MQARMCAYGDTSVEREVTFEIWLAQELKRQIEDNCNDDATP